MDIKQLRTFLAVADSRSFLRASENLYITRQAVSKTIKQLEEELQVELFNRSHDGVSMTPAGIFFYPRAATLVAEFDQLKRDTMDADRSYISKIQICMSQGIFSVFAEDLMKYSDDHRYEMNIQLRSCIDADCDSVLASRQVDAVVSFTTPTSSLAQTKVLLRSPVELLVHRNSEALEPLKNDPELYRNMPLLLYTGGRDHCLWWDDPPKETDIVCSDLGYLFSLLNTKKGIMPIPKLLTGDYTGYCETIACADPPAPVPLYWSTLYPEHYNLVTNTYLDVIYDDVFLEKAREVPL